MGSQQQISTMKSLLLFPVFVIPTVLAIPIGETRCEVRSEWNIDYKWTDITFSAWVPHEGISKEIIIIETHFKDFIYPVTFDKITLYENRIQINQMRNGKCTTLFNQKIAQIDGGWADFTLTVDSHYGLKYFEKTILAPNVSIDYMPMSLFIKGSNITLDCPAKLRTWEIAKSSVLVPLDSSKEHTLSFFSTREFSPFISLEEREFILGWDNETLTTIPFKAQPLPPFVQHYIMLKCQKHQRTICTMTVGEEMKEAEIIRLSDIPQSVSIKRNLDTNFFVILHQQDHISTLNTIGTTEKIPATSEGSSHNFLFVALMVTTGLSVSLIGKVCYISRKRNKMQEKMPEEQQSRGTTSKTFLIM